MKKVMITNVWNEEYLLPWFIQHHKQMFDHVVVVDYNSTDRSMDIVKELAPEWEIRKSKIDCFDAEKTDRQLMDIEYEFKKSIKITLNTTELLYVKNEAFWDDIKQIGCVKVPGIIMIDTIPAKIPTYDIPLYKQKNVGTKRLDTFCRDRRRFAFIHGNGAYTPGRHSTNHVNVATTNNANILWYGWSPWTEENIKRKCNIQKQVPQSDIQKQMGVHHLTNPYEQYQKWSSLLQYAEEFNL